MNTCNVPADARLERAMLAAIDLDQFAQTRAAVARMLERGPA